MSGQQGFVATDTPPPTNGPAFAKADIDDLGLTLCLTVWRRLQKLKHGGAA